MKPESLLGHTLELIEKVALPGPYPADARVGRFFRQRRYLGSHDRRFISEAVYAWLRYGYRARTLWRMWASGSNLVFPPDDALSEIESDLAQPREPLEVDEAQDTQAESEDAQQDAKVAALRTAYLLDVLAIARDGKFPWSFEETVLATKRLPDEESVRKNFLSRASFENFREPSIPSEDRVQRFAFDESLPPWLASMLLEEHEEESARQLAEAFLRPASIDLRVNLRLQVRDAARESLSAETGETLERTPFSPVGLRLDKRKNLTGTTASRRSWIEMQDEGSQIAVLCADPAPGMTVIDACAGNGGKTLCLADLLFSSRANEGSKTRVYACDVTKEKLGELERRARETGLAEKIRVVHIYPAGPLPESLPEADLILVDAPCSGLGTLRRNPELKRRYRPEDIAVFADLQLTILERFASLVKPRGRLSYINCSFLRQECEDVASRFESQHPEFTGSISRWAVGNLPPQAMDSHRIRLDPVVTKTDAFFVVNWTKQA